MRNDKFYTNTLVELEKMNQNNMEIDQVASKVVHVRNKNRKLFLIFVLLMVGIFLTIGILLHF